jgi:hypothetical protein
VDFHDEEQAQSSLVLPPALRFRSGANGYILNCASHVRTRRPCSLDLVRKPAGRGWHSDGGMAERGWSGIVTSFMASGYGVFPCPPCASFLMAGWRAIPFERRCRSVKRSNPRPEDLELARRSDRG